MKAIFALFVLMTLLPTQSSLAQNPVTLKVHPDLDVPKLEIKYLNQQKEAIEDAIKEIDLDKKVKKTELVALFPDFKDAHNQIADIMRVQWNTFLEDIKQLKQDALDVQKKFSDLQGKYSSELDSLERDIKAYPKSKDILKPAYELQKKRMREDLSTQFNYSVTQLNQTYSEAVGKLLKASRIIYLNRSSEMYSTNVPDDYISDYCVSHPSFHDSKVDCRKVPYARAFISVTDTFFTLCKTSGCVYGLGQDYKLFFKLVEKQNRTLKIGEISLPSRQRNIDLGDVNFFMDKATEWVANLKKDVAIFGPVVSSEGQKEPK